MSKTLLLVISLIIVSALVAVVLISTNKQGNINPVSKIITSVTGPIATPIPLSIASMRARDYPGSDITIEQMLTPHTTYNQYIASYVSDGLKIYALLTVPTGQKPSGGWPVILFNHGYIPPNVYRTTERYVAYEDAFARNGYIVFKPDYRGNGNSQGTPDGAYYSPAYAIDDLNALTSIKNYKDSNPNKIGVWGHSMGGNITLRDLVVNTKDIKAAVIWGGVVGTYEDLMYNWQRKATYVPPPTELAQRNNFRQDLINKYGDPRQNPNFWNSLDPTNFVKDIAAPVQLDVGGADEEVPVDFSKSLRDKLTAAGKYVEYYEYPGSDHNISQGFDSAVKHSLDFFDKYLKQ